jgi:glycine dehydrogenase subunit 1
VLLGETGRRLTAQLSAEKARYLAERLAEVPGVELVDPEAPFFREFAVRLPEGIAPGEVIAHMEAQGFLAGIPLERLPGGGEGLLIAVTEKRVWSEIESYVRAFRTVVAGFAVGSRV